MLRALQLLQYPVFFNSHHTFFCLQTSLFSSLHVKDTLHCTPSLLLSIYEGCVSVLNLNPNFLTCLEDCFCKYILWGPESHLPTRNIKK